jgi:hypothetical protein
MQMPKMQFAISRGPWTDCSSRGFDGDLGIHKKVCENLHGSVDLLGFLRHTKCCRSPQGGIRIVGRATDTFNCQSSRGFYSRDLQCKTNFVSNIERN